MNTAQGNNIKKWFNRLDSWGITYYLLRPVSLVKEEKDLDLIMSEDDVNRLVDLLKAEQISAEVTTSIAENSVGIKVDDDLLLDIKTKVCFLPSKFYSFKASPPYSGVVEKNNILYPDVADEVLFTFWVLHFFLDKKHPSMSGSYHIFCEKYEHSSLDMIQSEFFQFWLQKVFGRKRESAEYVITQFCKNNFQTTLELTRFTKELILKKNLITFIKFYLEKAKYAIIRRTTKEFYRPITAYNC